MELQDIFNRTLVEVAVIQKAYRKQIVASQAFGYISMAFMIALPVTIILNDLGKLHHKKSLERLANRIAKLKAAKREALAGQRRDGLKMCEEIRKTRKQISDFDSLFLKSLMKMHVKRTKKISQW